MTLTQFDTRSSEIQGEFQRWLLEVAETNDASMSRLRKKLSEAIQEELTPRQQQILQMCLLDGCSAREVARQLGVNPSTVIRTRDRALQRLHKVLKYAF